MTLGEDLCTDFQKVHSFSFIYGADDSNFPEYSGDQVKSWPIADSSVIPPPPNTPASHLVSSRQNLLADAYTECFQERSRSRMRDILANLPFRIDPITKVIRAGTFINYRGPPRSTTPARRAQWRNFLPVQTWTERAYLRSRKHGPTDTHQPKELLKRKLHNAAFDDYVQQMYILETERASYGAFDQERAALQATAKRYSQPGHEIADICTKETVEEKVKNELAMRNTKRFSRRNVMVKHRRPKFVEMFGIDVLDKGLDADNASDFVVAEKKKSKMGSKIMEKINALKEKAGKAKGKFLKMGSSVRFSKKLSEPLDAVHF